MNRVFYILIALLLLAFDAHSWAVGKVDIYLFQDGKPVKDVQVELNGRSFKSNDEGNVSQNIEGKKVDVGVHFIGIALTRTSADIFDEKSTEIIFHRIGNEVTISKDVPEIKSKTVATENILTEQGTLNGTIASFENGKLVAGAEVFVKGQNGVGITDEQGEFELKLPVGKHSLSIIHNSYSSLTVSDITITKNQKLKRLFRLTPSAIALQDFVVTAPHIKGSTASLLDERKEASSINDVLGAEQMSKSGDSNAASALRRVTGLTLVDGKYIYVRGLGERYSNSLLNGSQLPSPEPTRRVVPLDIFPAGVLESVVVQKSFSPDMPGEFGGGSIGLRTKSIPEKFFLNWSISTSFNNEDEGPLLRYKGGKKDYLGYDDGTRNIPDAIKDANEKGRITSGPDFTDEEIKNLGREFDNNYNVTEEKNCNKIGDRFSLDCATNLNFTLTVGDRFQTGIGKFGYLTSFRYGHEFENNEFHLSRYNGSNGKLDGISKDLDYMATTRKVDATSLVNLGYEFGSNKLNLVNLIARKSSDKVQIKQGTTGGGDDTSRTTTLEWVEQELIYNQISGHHSPFHFYDIDWRYSLSDAIRYAPDTRTYQYDEFDTDLPYVMSTRSSGNSRDFSLLKDKGEDAAVDFTFKFPFQENFTAKLKTGVNIITRSRNSKTRRFGYNFTSWQGISAETRRQNPESIFTRENIDTDRLTLSEGTRNTDRYRATQTIDAAYGMLDLSLFENIFINAGMRIEKSTQKVLTFDLHDVEANAEVAELKTTHKLPSLNLTYRLNDKMQFRLGYSKTVSRPDFRELSSATYTDDQFDVEVSGYPDLVTSDIHNYDARWEWYLTSKSNISLGYFVKEIKNPIEKVLLNAAGGDVIQSYRNSKKSKNHGWEFEFAQGWDFSGHSISFGGNYSKIYSAIELDFEAIEGQSTLTTKNRAMQGVSPYSANVNISYGLEGWGMEHNLVVNEIGPRISELGISGMPDVYEESSRQIDYIFKQKIPYGLSLGFKAKNLGRAGVKTTQDGKVILDKAGNQSYSISLSGKI